MSRWSRALAFLVLAFAPAVHALGEKAFVEFAPSPGAALVADGETLATLVTDSGEDAGVVRAAADLQADIERVTGKRPGLMRGAKAFGPHAIIIGTLGKSGFIDGLAQSGVIDVSAIRGQWEGYVIQAIVSPWNDRQPMLVIAGSDRRGTIYGIYALSEQIGVSPWYWWADVPVTQRKSLFVPAATRIADKPVVQYRGIFLNDEAPALSGWVKEKFGGYNHKFYTKVFELILRLRGNYLWPAMWPPTAFYDDDPENGRLANEYGIVVGTSHHEPMMRAHAEWHRGPDKGPWNYEKNAERLQEFWRGGVKNTRDYERVVTLGMRGDGDEPMSEGANVALLERIVADQRRILAEERNTNPQLWALYKEVQEYYERGMRVPDDVMLLWCDDNWGNIRRLPTPEERKRPGGAGIYYHFDYVGSPRNYKWINVTPLPKVWEQMHLAWKYGADRLWIVNVGDLKPMEVPIEFFLHYAWNPGRWPSERLDEYLRLWAAREFGGVQAGDIARLVAGYSKFNGRRKPEMLAPDTYSLHNYREAESVVSEYNAYAERAEVIGKVLPERYRDAYYQLVLHPVKAVATLNELYVAAARNRLYGLQGRASTNDEAERVRRLFALDAELTRRYHELGGGKWNHMMSQTHIGYTYWNQPPRNTMPPVTEVQVPRAGDMGVAVEGSEVSWPGRGANRLALPVLDAYEQGTRYLEVFNRGEEPFAFEVAASEPWITLSQASGTVTREARIEVGAKWSEVPAGATGATLTVSGPNDRRVVIQVPVHKPVAGAPAAGAGFIETRGVVAIEAEHYSNSVAPANRQWLRIADHGRTLSGVTPMPVDVVSTTTGADAMRLEYRMHLFTAGKVTVHATLAPTQKFQPGPGLRFAISFDDDPPQVVNVHADESRVFWSKTVADGVVVLTSDHVIAKPGAHTLKYWALDPGLVLQKIVVDTGGLLPSYLGPPESPRR